MEKKAADVSATVTQATAFNVAHQLPKAQLRHHAQTDPALSLVTGALPAALCTLMTSKHFPSCPPEGQVSGSA